MFFLFFCVLGSPSCLKDSDSVNRSHTFVFLTVSEPCNKSEDGAFDIITEEEVNGVYDSDTTSQATAGSLDGEQEQQPQGVLDM